MRKRIRSALRILPMLAAAGSLFVAGAASATPGCGSQAAIAGIWQVYALSIKQGQPSWTRCVLHIDEKGVFGAPSKCAGADGVEVLAGGKFQSLSDMACTYSGFISHGNVRHTIVHATMDRYGSQIDGVGTFPGGQFMLDGVRRLNIN